MFWPIVFILIYLIIDFIIYLRYYKTWSLEQQMKFITFPISPIWWLVHKGFIQSWFK